MNLKKGFIPLMISIFGFLIMSSSFLLIPIDIEVISLRISGFMFWSGLIVGIGFQVYLSIYRRNMMTNRIRRKINRQVKIGIISLCRNTVAIIFDSIMAISVIGLIITMILTNGMGTICYVFIFLTIFSFCMHCIFNGRIYYYITGRSRKKHYAENSIKIEKEDK